LHPRVVIISVICVCWQHHKSRLLYYQYPPLIKGLKIINTVCQNAMLTVNLKLRFTPSCTFHNINITNQQKIR
jgi:hypothetical protein